MTILISSAQAAVALGVKIQTLRAWRVQGKGPRYVRLGDNRLGRVGYRPEDVAAWIDARVAASTSEETVRAAAGASE
ncbi:MAG: transcriptional regulator [Deltaproteobacteria bacterium]|nr:transcriptional regulator [Deltaproteobacteria bacterium]